MRRQFLPLFLRDRMFSAIAIAAARVALILLPTTAQPQIDISQILRAGATGDAIRHRLRDASSSLNSRHTHAGGIMAFVGVVVTLVGFLLAAGSVGLTAANSARLVIVLVGIAISLGGIFGILNPAYQKDVVWKR
jgi:hypothetical protein